MAAKEQAVIFDEDVYVITPRGSSELNGSSTSLAPPELELMVQIDGKSTVAEIKARAKSLSPEAVTAAVKKLMWHNYIKMAEKTNALDFVEFFNTKTSAAPSEGALTDAEAEAVAGTSTLEREGYYVRIARRAPTELKLAAGQKPSVIVIEDEPHLVKFLKQFLTLEGFDARVASNRAEILSEIGRPPRPDLMLLDVTLPDADGFDILLKMRQHPNLKTMPVIMLTAKATRDAVIRGLASGADGYVTKPFEADALLKAIKTVLGLPAA